MRTSRSPAPIRHTQERLTLQRRTGGEGAAYNLWNGGGTAVSFTSMPLDRTQNRASGRALGIWYAVDNILEGDLFYVDITS